MKGTGPAWPPTREAFDCKFMRDANCVNARGKDANLSRLEQWARDGVITLQWCATSADEACAGAGEAAESRRMKVMDTRKPLDGGRTLQTVATQLQWITDEPSQGENVILSKVQNVLVHNRALTIQDKTDIDIIFEAWKYKLILITNDGDSNRQPRGILGSAADLRRELGVRVMRPADAVGHTRSAINNRDEYARSWADETGNALPEWVGRDA
ncbi:MAG: hypothetical protein NT029_08285 [Armatimonadetes bacterium]|nr:hypothetical protein [Armatimonadota bacterium]